MSGERIALLVIDMINDFATPGGVLYSEAVGAIVPAVAREIARAKSAGDPVIFVCDTHGEGDPEFAPRDRRVSAMCCATDVAGDAGAADVLA